MEFEDKEALIIGAGKGIGKALATGFVAEGARVCVNDIVGEDADKTAEEFGKLGGTALAVQADVSNEADVKRMFETLFGRFGTIDILVNNAGIGDGLMVEGMPNEAWRRTIDINLNAVFLSFKAAMPSMQAKRYGKMVNIASVAAKKISFHGGADYTASKAGVLGFTRHLAYELTPFGINVNAVCPGATLTPLLKSRAMPAQIEKEALRTAVGKLCEPEDIADAVLFLCSNRSKMIVGQALDVDAGELLVWTDSKTYRQSRKDDAKNALRQKSRT